MPPETIADDPLARVRIPCFGDQLTRVRLAGAKDLRAGRLDHLYPFRIVDWHTKRSFLKVSTTLQLNKPVFEILKFTLGHKITVNEAKEMHFYSLNLHLFVCFFLFPSALHPIMDVNTSKLAKLEKRNSNNPTLICTTDKHSCCTNQWKIFEVANIVAQWKINIGGS